MPAGRFGEWLDDLQAALRGERDADVPCDGCTACCTSSQFIHVGPDESEALAQIPAELLFPAPHRPPGHVLMGYDEQGRCPMLVGGACSIYEHRPRTCRTYDCRVFPAAGIEPDPDGQPAIAARVRRWRFDEGDDLDAVRHDAVRAAAAFVRANRELVPDRVLPATAAQHAVLAIALHGAFIDVDGAGGRPVLVEPATDVVDGLLQALGDG